MKTLNVTLAMIVVLAVASTGYAEVIKYRGSSTVGQFIYDAAKVYNRSTFDIDTKSESSGGEDSAATGRTDLGGVARDVRQKILDKGVKKFLIGKDAIGILVHPSNPVAKLSKEQLSSIFTGEITNWKEVGGRDIDIDVYIVNPRSATRKVFKQTVLGDKKYAGKRIKTIRPDQRIIEEVERNPAGIGQLSFSFLEGANVKRIWPDGEEPSVNNPNYPITRNLHLVTKGDPKGEIKEFIDWVLSPEGQKVVKIHFIGVK
ncbi:MAG: phosphate ABC transporter substrate-binding protein [Deltaproteobacteria bacterium]|uniref:Phosphate ABC transporter substrate-binding protein n=1 Tax=Candidatus Desulfacyla euxinica TaxID=2841693 RepID=A0A8J6T7D5_9DELT|nr:phosphate ABC transporter substrate-binding protein [Candidatus Desulfacyla euxinica]MBL7217926.1 phosphate ABC transporter substrate-binding protein [Desulfobacteraceae bacterium]